MFPPSDNLIGGRVVHVNPPVRRALQPLSVDHILSGGRYTAASIAETAAATARHRIQHKPVKQHGSAILLSGTATYLGQTRNV
jgi:hypothetical protein